MVTRFFYITSCLLIVSTSCIPSPHSRIYKPLTWEEPLLQNADKSIMPSDVRNDIERYKDSYVHWVGIIDSAWLSLDQQPNRYSIRLNQKYYDYVEDFSIQRETMFISPIGEGSFIFTKSFKAIPNDTTLQAFEVFTTPGNLGFCYGKISGYENNTPIIEGIGIRFFPEEDFATTIFSYEVARDSTGVVILNAGGFPELTNIKILKVAGPGKND